MNALHQALKVAAASWLQALEAHHCLREVSNALSSFERLLMARERVNAPLGNALETLWVHMEWVLAHYGQELYRLLVMIPEGEFELADMLRADTALGIALPYRGSAKLQTVRCVVLGDSPDSSHKKDTLWASSPKLVRVVSDWLDEHHPGYGLTEEQKRTVFE
jgi:hypothetical protein